MLPTYIYLTNMIMKRHIIVFIHSDYSLWVIFGSQKICNNPIKIHLIIIPIFIKLPVFLTNNYLKNYRITIQLRIATFNMGTRGSRTQVTSNRRRTTMSYPKIGTKFETSFHNPVYSIKTNKSQKFISAS